MSSHHVHSWVVFLGVTLGWAMLAGPLSGQANKPAEPATAEEAARVLDLRTFARMQGAKVSSISTLGMLLYEAPGILQQAFDFQKQRLEKLGFQELPGRSTHAAGISSRFTKEGYHVAVSATQGSQKEWASVSLVNDGNVAVEKLPVPPGAKPFYPQAYRAAYTTTVAPAETAAACRKLLLAAGWEAYGETEPNPSQPDMTMQYFKRNAIKLQSWVMKTPAEGGKTLLQYDTELLAADLPAPAEANRLQYTDSQKRLWFEAPADKTAAILAFYTQRLPQKNWQATTERPITDDQKQTQFLIFRNPQRDLLSLDLAKSDGKVTVTLTHQSAAEVAAEEARAKQQAELAKQEMAKKNKPVPVALALPAGAANIEKKSASELDFALPTGSGPAALAAFREQLTKAGWIEEKGNSLDKTIGSLIVTQEHARLTLSYFDLGLGEVDITVAGTANVVLTTSPSTDKSTAAAPPVAKKPAPAGIPGIPGLPALPPGVELPPEAKALLQKALQDAGGKKPGQK